MRNRANANAARARANANAAKNANARVNEKINNLANIRDVVTLMLSKDQLIEIAKNLKVSYTKSSTVPKLKDTIFVSCNYDYPFKKFKVINISNNYQLDNYFNIKKYIN